MRSKILPATLAGLTVGLCAVASAPAQAPNTTCPAGQGQATAYCELSQNGGRVPPKAFSAVTKHHRSRVAGTANGLRTTGVLGLPSVVSTGTGCTGKVKVTYKIGKTTLSTHKPSLHFVGGRCIFATTVGFKAAALRGAGGGRHALPRTMTVLARFQGNVVLKPSKTKKQRISVG